MVASSATASSLLLVSFTSFSRRSCRSMPSVEPLLRPALPERFTEPWRTTLAEPELPLEAAPVLRVVDFDVAGLRAVDGFFAAAGFFPVVVFFADVALPVDFFVSVDFFAAGLLVDDFDFSFDVDVFCFVADELPVPDLRAAGFLPGCLAVGLSVALSLLVGVFAAPVLVVTVVAFLVVVVRFGGRTVVAYVRRLPAVPGSQPARRVHPTACCFRSRRRISSCRQPDVRRPADRASRGLSASASRCRA